MNYRIGSGLGQVLASNGAVEVFEGVGKQYPFAATYGGVGSASRRWNGRVRYRVIESALPYVETFSPGFPGTFIPRFWEQILDDADPVDGPAQDWISSLLPTPSPGTGPNSGQGVFGNFVYVEDSGAEHLSVALSSPIIDFASAAEPMLSFWYHSERDETAAGGQNSLRLDAITPSGLRDTLLVIRDEGSEWRQIFIDLRPLADLGQPRARFEFSVNNRNGGGNHDIAIDSVRVEDGGFALFGTGEDLVLWTELNGNGGGPSPIKSASAGDVLRLELFSPGGRFARALPIVGAQLHEAALPPGSILPQVHLDLNPAAPAIVLYDGGAPGPLGPRTLGLEGLGLNFHLPLTLGAYELRLQGLALSPVAANGIYASSVAHRIQLP